jgi:hypothetical protein
MHPADAAKRLAHRLEAAREQIGLERVAPRPGP